MDARTIRTWRTKDRSHPGLSRPLPLTLKVPLLIAAFITIWFKFSYLPRARAKVFGANPAAAEIQFKGKDILIVLGSDGKHPLDVHCREIRDNREDYAIFHGNSFNLFTLIDSRVPVHVRESVRVPTQ
jgi:hypothetical protein